jgi:hypothetical protein
VITSRRRFSVRSTSTPAQGESTSIGPNWQADSTPTAVPLPVRRSTSSVRATIVSQLPVLEIVCPTKNSRKLRERSDASVRATKPPTGGAPRAPVAGLTGPGPAAR